MEHGNHVRLGRHAAFLSAALTLALAVVMGGVGMALNRSFKNRSAEFEQETIARQAAERINQRLFDSSGDCIVLLEPDGRMLSMNRPGLKMMEIDDAERGPGEPWPALWGASGTLARRALVDALESGESRFQGPRRTRTGDVHWWDVAVTVIRDDAGTVTLLSVSRDMTAQQPQEEELRESEERFRSLADAMPQIAWSARADGKHDYFNARWYEYTGLPHPGGAGGELDSRDGLGWRWSDYLHPGDADATLHTWTHSLTTGEPYHVRCRLRRADGLYRWFIGRALPSRNPSGAITRWFATCTDIDEEKRQDDERAQLLASERAARSEAERSARLKDEFVSTLSHELRTPLNAIVGWIGVLKHNPSAEDIEKGLGVIDRNLRRQSQMIDDLLDMSRIISGKMLLELQPVDLGSIIDEAVASALPAAAAKGVRIATQLGPAASMQGDPARLQQVVWNLVANAVKFTPKGGRVRVALRKAESDVFIEVSDTGIGIGSEFLPHLFQRFRQADASSTRQHGGLGLGLAIVKNLVEEHGGWVQASSQGEGRGSVFTVRLSVALAPSAPAGEDIAAPELERAGAGLRDILTGLRILVLDDEPDARDLVRWFLEHAGAEAAVADSVDRALTMLKEGLVPDIIVSDIGMPDRDGYDFMRQVRRLEGAASKTPAAALTALARSDDRKRALLAGYQTHLAKPVDPLELVAVVASLAGRTGRSHF
ncbi:MAG: response regulator [Acidobacteria bacterium]|nr:response regulator [Acidobacteriota bacterium]